MRADRRANNRCHEYAFKHAVAAVWGRAQEIEAIDLLVLPPQRGDRIEVQIRAWHRDVETGQKLQKVPGIGPARVSALAAAVGKATDCDNGWQMAA